MDRRIYSITGEMSEYGGGISPFGGYFLLDPLSHNILGNIGDELGVAEIYGRFDSNESLSFCKDYKDKIEKWNYEFELDSQKGIWLGKYSAVQNSCVGNGKAVCQIFPTKFSLPNYPKGIAGISSEESWDRIIDGMIEDKMLVPADS